MRGFPTSAEALAQLEVVRGQAAASPTPALVGFFPMLPASGATMALKAANPSNGIDRVSMSRFQVPVTDDVHIFAPVWAGWGIIETVDVDTSALLMETDNPNDVQVSAAVETIDGRRFRLSANGSYKWTVKTGATVRCDPIDIDVPVGDGYFWLRTRVEVAAGGVWWQNKHVSNIVTGQLVVNYAVDPTLDYSTAILALTPNLYWKLNQADGATDKSGNGRNGTAAGGAVIGQAVGLFSDGATFLDESVVQSQNVTSTYNPFTNGQPLSVVGLAYRDDIVDNDTIFSSDAGAANPTLRINTDASPSQVTFWPATGGVNVSWDDVWPVATWVHWALVFDEPGDTVELFLNGVSVGVKAMVGAYNVAPGNFDLGARAGGAEPFGGRVAHTTVFANTKLTAGQITTLYSAMLSTATDQTNGTGPLVTVGSSSSGPGSAHAPVLLAGKINPTVHKAIVSIWGDSLTEGVGDSPDATEGFATKACRLARIPSVKLGKGSERGVTQTVSTRIARRLALADGATHAIYEHGVNDYRSSVLRALPPYLAANTIINAYRLANRGQKVYATTLTPGASSTDVWATVVNQTPHQCDSWRTRYNDWLRAGAPIAATVLTAATAINGATITGLADTSAFQAPGLAIFNGTLVAYTGKTATTLTGCTAAILPYAAPSATVMPVGSSVFGIVGWMATQAGTGQTLPLATVNLFAGFTSDGFTPSGTLLIGCIAGTGTQTVTYTGKTTTSFTGVAGGVGAIGTSGILQDTIVPAGALVAGQGGHPLTSFFEIADTVESSRNSGRWKAPGYTADGIHPSAVGHAAMAAGINTGLFIVP